MAEALSPDKVRYAKQMLLEGHRPVEIARALECSVETIRRYKRGESRTSVLVEGEERLRPRSTLPPMVSEVAESAEVDVGASLERLQGLLKGE